MSDSVEQRDNHVDIPAIARWVAGKLPEDHHGRAVGTYTILAAATQSPGVVRKIEKADFWMYISAAESLLLDAMAATNMPQLRVWEDGWEITWRPKGKRYNTALKRETRLLALLAAADCLAKEPHP